MQSIQLNPAWLERFIQDKPREKDNRPPFRRDRARILHSPAFRCLQAKTQIHAIGENDFYRTRLTHSLEVAQIGTSLVAQLRFLESYQFLAQQLNQEKTELQKQLKPLLPTNDLIESLCFAHDIGHPPFGHGGEVALNYMMQQYNGFEGNAQTFRILTKLEPYTPDAGMNLTRRTLLGVIKYPTFLNLTSPVYPQLNEQQITDPRYLKIQAWRPGKGLFEDDKAMFEWVIQPLTDNDKKLFQSLVKIEMQSGETQLKSRFKSLDCSIMELADDIAYAVHDLEDAIVTGIVNINQWQLQIPKLKDCNCAWIKTHIDKLTEDLFSNIHYQRKNAIGALVNYFITHVHWVQTSEFDEPLLAYNAKLPEPVTAVLKVFKTFVYDYVIRDVDTQRIEYKGQRMLIEMFQIFDADPERLLPRNTVMRWQNAQTEQQKKRVICDYIAGMSDAYALRVYQQL